MGNNKKRRLYVGLGSILITIWLIAFAITYVNMQKTQATINAEMGKLLEEAVRNNAREKAKDIYVSGIAQEPEQIEKIESRVFRSADTSFVYKREVADAATTLFQSQQLVLLLTDSLRSADVRLAFDSLLLSRQVLAMSAIRMVASGRLKELTCYSGDTTSMNIDNRAIYRMDDGLENIEYTAYIDYSFMALWRLTPKPGISVSLLLSFLLVGGAAGYVFMSKEKKKETPVDKKTEVTEKRLIDIDYNATQIKKLLHTQGEGVVVFQGEEIILPPQPLNILLFFLRAELFRVNKQELQIKFWYSTKNKVGHMASAVRRINEEFEQKRFPFKIITDVEDRAYYILSITH